MVNFIRKEKSQALVVKSSAKNFWFTACWPELATYLQDIDVHGVLCTYEVKVAGDCKQ